MKKFKLPTFEECKKAFDFKKTNRLQLFIYDNEPAGAYEGVFRRQLSDAFIEVLSEQNERVKHLENIINGALCNDHRCGLLITSMEGDYLHRCQVCKMKREASKGSTNV